MCLCKDAVECDSVLVARDTTNRMVQYFEAFVAVQIGVLELKMWSFDWVWRKEGLQNENHVLMCWCYDNGRVLILYFFVLLILHHQFISETSEWQSCNALTVIELCTIAFKTCCALLAWSVMPVMMLFDKLSYVFCIKCRFTSCSTFLLVVIQDRSSISSMVYWYLHSWIFNWGSSWIAMTCNLQLRVRYTDGRRYTYDICGIAQ